MRQDLGQKPAYVSCQLPEQPAPGGKQKERADCHSRYSPRCQSTGLFIGLFPQRKSIRYRKCRINPHIHLIFPGQMDIFFRQKRMCVIEIILSDVFLHHAVRTAVKRITASHTVKEVFQFFLTQVLLLKCGHIGVQVSVSKIPECITHIHCLTGPALFHLLILCHIFSDCIHCIRYLVDYGIVIFLTFVDIFLNASVKKRPVWF